MITLRVLFVGNFHSEVVGTRSSAEELSTALARCGVRAIRSSSLRSAIPKAADMAATVVRRRRDYDLAIVDVYSGRAFRWAELTCLALSQLSKPHVVNLVGGGLPAFARQHPRRTRRLLAHASVVTAPSPYISEAMHRYTEDIELLPSHGIEMDRYPFRVRSPCGPRIVWLRAFHEIYAPTLALEVLGALVERYPDVCLVMVGPDKRDGSLERVRSLALDRGLTERLKIVGPVPKADVPKHLDRADVFLNTTRVESLGVSVIEAMACGLCVVSTDAGSLPDLLRDGVNSMLVPSDDAAAMGRAVRRVLEDDVLAERISEGARITSRSYAWPRITSRWVQLLEGISTGPVRRPG